MYIYIIFPFSFPLFPFVCLLLAHNMPLRTDTHTDRDGDGDADRDRDGEGGAPGLQLLVDGLPADKFVVRAVPSTWRRNLLDNALLRRAMSTSG